MFIMTTAALSSVSLVILLQFCGETFGQTGRCNPETRHACTENDSLQLCRDVGGEHWQADGPLISCSLLNGQSTCYGGASDLRHVCGPSPPSCVQEGNFIVPGAGCRDYYICTHIGVNLYHRFLAECLPDHTFMNGRCVQDFNRDLCNNNITTPARYSTTPVFNFTSDFYNTTYEAYTTTSTFYEINATNFETITPASSPTRETLSTEQSTATSTSLVSSENTTTLRPETTTTTAQQGCTPGDRYPDPNNCTKFFRCVANGRIVSANCPFRYVFDIPSQLCKDTTECGARPIS